MLVLLLPFVLGSEDGSYSNYLASTVSRYVSFYKFGVLFVAVLILRALLFGVACNTQA